MIDADIYYAERIKNPITPIDQLKTPARGFLMGFLPMPNNVTTLDEAYKLAQSSADFVPVWGRPTPYYELAEDLDGPWGDIFLDGLIRGKGLTPIFNVNFMGLNMSLDHPEYMQWVTLNSPFWRNSYREAVLDVVRAARPRYLSIGNEVNRWYEQYGLEGDNGFRHYVSLYEEIYDAVKELSPETIVFCTFSREIVSQQREADLSVLSLFNQSKLDLIVFTSYPFAVKGVDNPDDLPNDYYTRVLADIPGKPLAFTELGWITHEAFGGEAGQAAFLSQVLGRLTEGADVEFLGWCWLSDLTAADKTGLFSYPGGEKAAWSVWENIYNEGQR